MKEGKEVKLHLDSQNRICLTKLLPPQMKFSSFRAHLEGGNIILKPMMEIPAREIWVYDDPELLKSLDNGIQAAKEGRVGYLGSFAEYTEDEV